MLPSLKSNHAFLHSFLRPYIFAALGASLFSLVLSLCATFLAILIGPALRLLMDMDFQKTVALSELVGPRLSPFLERVFSQTHISLDILIIQLPLVLLTLAFLKLILGTSQYFLWERTSERISKDLRQHLNERFLAIHPSLRKYKSHQEREAQISTLITTDVKLIREYFVHFYGGLPRELLQILFIGQTLVLLSPKLCAIFFFGIIPGIAIVQHLGRKLKKRAQLALQDYSELTEWLQQRLLGIETIKHYRTENLETAKMRQLSEGLVRKFLRAVRVKARTSPLLECLGITAMALVLYVAFQDIQNETLQASVAISFFAGLALVAQSGNTVGRYVNSNREGSAALERVRLFLQGLNEESKIQPEQNFADQDAILEFKNVEARYPDSEKLVLHSFSFRFEPGKIYCLKGPSGSGKTTLFNVIKGNLIPSSGTLQFHKELSEHGFGYLPQHVHLMDGSLFQNVIYPDADGDRARVTEILNSVGLWDMVVSKEQGLDSRVGGGGLELSGGQSQRIHIARLLYHKYPLILIDEGTSALDPESENTICKLLRSKAQSSTCILMISHRPAPFQYADVTLDMSEGRLVKTSPAPSPAAL